MNLEKLNNEFDEYLDEFQVTDAFSTTRVMNFKQKKKRFLLPVVSICLLVCIFFVGKELIPISDPPNNGGVAEQPPVVEQPSEEKLPPMDEPDSIIFNKDDKGFSLDGITLGMNKEELIAILGTNYDEDLEPEFFGYSYENQTNILYDEQNLTIILSNDTVVEMIYKDIDIGWFNNIYQNYSGKKYENLVAGTMEDASSIRMLYIEGLEQMIYVKYTPAVDGIEVPFYTLYFKPFTENERYYISQNIMNYRMNELTKVETVTEEEKELLAEGYKKMKSYIESEFGDYYYLSHFEYDYEKFSYNDETILSIAIFANMPAKNEIDEHPDVIEIRERMKLESENQDQLQKEFDQLFLEIVASNTSRNQSTFHFGILIKDNESEIYHLNISSDLLTLIGF